MNWGEYVAAHSWQFAALGCLLIASGFFSGTETALFTLTRGQLYRLRQSRRGVGRLIASIMRRPRRVLQTLLLGNMIVNVAYAALSAVMVLSLTAAGASALAVVVATILPILTLILVGEVTPKMFAYRVAPRWSKVAAGPMVVIIRALTPLVWILERVLVAPLTFLIAPQPPGRKEITSRELAALLDLSARRGLIDRDANALLREIMQLTDIRVADLMVPRVDMVAYDVNDPPAGLADLFRTTHLRKIPVYDGDIDHILGVVYAKALLQRDVPLRNLVVEVPFVPETVNIERAMLQLRVTRRQTAIAVDEYGGVAGLITLEDIIEEIVGDIAEPQEPPGEPPVRQIGHNEYHIDGDLAIHEWVEAFGIDVSGHRISTVGGFVVTLLGRIPAVGDTATYRNLRFTVEAMRGRRVSRLKLDLLKGGRQ